MSNAVAFSWATRFDKDIHDGNVSLPFPVPGGFCGHLYTRGPGGNQKAIFAIDSDRNARFDMGGGFKVLVGSLNMLAMDITFDTALEWQIVGLPNIKGPVDIALVSAAFA